MHDGDTDHLTHRRRRPVGSDPDHGELELIKREKTLTEGRTRRAPTLGHLIGPGIETMPVVAVPEAEHPDARIAFRGGLELAVAAPQGRESIRIYGQCVVIRVLVSGPAHRC